MKTEDKIVRARIQLITGGDPNKKDKERIGMSFLGTLALGLRVVDVTGRVFADSQSCSTMAVDGKNLFFDRDFVDKITKEELIGVIAHEVMHIVYQHTLEWRNTSSHEYPLIFTIAQEQVVNDSVLNMFKLDLPKNRIYYPKYKGMYTEQVYKKLIEDIPKKTLKDLRDIEQILKDGMIDVHDIAITDNDGNVIRGQTLDSELKSMARNIKLKVAQAANTARQKGTLPSGLSELLDELFEAKLPWRQILSEFLISSMSKDNYCWSRPNRRHLSRGIILPALHSESIEIAIAFDTSGSISKKELESAWDECRGILGAFTSYTVHLMGCDMECTDIQSIGPHDEPDTDKLFIGRGGTCFIAPFDKMQEEGINPSAVVYFTADACGSFLKEPPNFPVLWVVKGGAMDVPWGRRIELD